MAITSLNARADAYSASMAAIAIENSATALANLLKLSLGPKGKEKLLVGGAGQVKLTKDGTTLLREMQIQHPISQMIARCATAQDESCGDHTLTCVIMIGEILNSIYRSVAEGKNKIALVDGINAACVEATKILKSLVYRPQNAILTDIEILTNVARTALSTKLSLRLVNTLAADTAKAVKIVSVGTNDIDLHMIEIMTQKKAVTPEAKLIEGLVLDHGCRHPDMPRELKNVYILICNISLEYEKSEVNSSFYYSDPNKREDLVVAEREFTDEKVRQIIDLKRRICDTPDKSFAIFNQKGIDPPSLDMLAREGIMALRRIKRRNLERLSLMCHGSAMNSLEGITEKDIGWAGHVWEERQNDDVFTFVQEVRDIKSCVLFIRGYSDYGINQIKDAIRDALRAIKNAIQKGGIVPGAGATEMMVYRKLKKMAACEDSNKHAGIELLANAFLAIPRILSQNAKLNTNDVIVNLERAQDKDENCYGIDLQSGSIIDPITSGILDTLISKTQIMEILPNCVEQLVLVDEIIRAGKSMGKS